MRSTRPCSARPAKQEFSRTALPALLAGDEAGVEIDEREARALADGDRGGLEAEERSAGGHPLEQQLQLDRAGQHELGVERGEGGLEPGGAHRRLLEGHLLLLARVRGVVGGDAVDDSGAEPLEQRGAVLGVAERRVDLGGGVEPAHVLFAEEQVVRGHLGAHAGALGLRLRDRVHGLRGAQMLEVHAAPLVGGERGVARDHRGLAHARDAAEAERGADGSLAHDPSAREREVLLVQREHPAAEALVAKRPAQHGGAHHGSPVVGEAERALARAARPSPSAPPRRGRG